MEIVCWDLTSEVMLAAMEQDTLMTTWINYDAATKFCSVRRVRDPRAS